VAGKGLHQVMLEPIAQLRAWFDSLRQQLPSDEAAAQLLLEIRNKTWVFV